MADITGEDTNLKDLRQRAKELALGVESLAAQFEKEDTHLKQRDDVARLRALCSAVLQGMEWAKSMERAASYGHTEARMVSSLFQVGAGLIMMMSEDRMMQAISHELLAGPRGREPNYGSVLVRIGPEGLPEDVEVISISSLARESKLGESEVINRLLESGNLLFGEESFSHLIDRLTGEILKGKLSLPVSAERLSRLQGWRAVRLNPKNKDEPI
jgi:hypothetical protein